jgi:hypothetical protein
MRALHLSSAMFLVLAALHAGAETASASSCADRVSSGDQSIGITAVEDAACATGGLGCFPDGDQCRFCRVSNTTEAGHLKLCADVQVSSVESAPAVKTKVAVTSSEESAVDCVSLVSVGDQGVGISAVAATSPTCSAEGLGCFQSGQCRFCQTRATVQSAPFLKCADVGGSSTSTRTTAPTSAPATSVASTSTTCSTVVTQAGLQGISYVLESRCNVASPTLLGCSARTSCRLCRNYKNEANQYLVSCRVLKDQGATESATASSTSTESGTTESVAIDASASDTYVQSSAKLSVSTGSAAAGDIDPAAMAAAPIGAAAAAVALLVVVMMSVMYVKGRRDPMDEPMTPEDGPGGDLLTPHGGRGYTPREGSLVMVVSQSSIATL